MTAPDNTSDADYVSRAFNDLPAVEPGSTLMRQVAQIPLEHPRSAARWWWPFESLWQPSMGLSLAAVLGLVVGQASFMKTPQSGASSTSAADPSAQVDSSLEEAALETVTASSLEEPVTDDDVDAYLESAFGVGLVTSDDEEWL